MALANITNNILTDSGILVTNLTPTSRTITINGVTYDLSADRSWTIATGVGGSGTTNYLPKFTGTSTIGNSAVTDDGTTVTLVSRALSGTSASFSGAVNANVYNLAGLTGGGALSWTTNTLRLGQDSYFETLQFWTNGSEKMRLNASGNLGLGVTPSAWNSAFVGLDFNLGGWVASQNNVNIIHLGSNAYVSTGGNWVYKNTTFASRYEQYESVHKWFTAPSGTAGNAISFTQAMTLDASGNLMVGGTSVYGATITSYGSATRSGGIGIRNSAGTVAGFFGTYASGSGSGSTDIFAESAGFMAFASGGSERLRITSGGNVGIGTTSPVVRLDYGSTTGQAFHLYTSGADYYGINMAQYDSANFSTNIFSGNNGEIKLRTASGTSTQSTRMTIVAGGNVGIGTTTPAVELAVYSSSTSRIHVQNSTTGVTNTDGFQMAISGADAYLWNFENATMRFATNNTERMRLDASGNLGIGTTAPNSLLEVNKTITFSSVDTYGQLVVKTTSGANGKLLNIGVDETNSVSFIQSLNRGTDAMPLSLQRYGGAVLIGTTTEGFLGKLQVAGSVAITGQYNTVLPSSSFSYFDGSGQVVSSSSSASALYLDTTWNTTGNPDGIYLNVTNTASGASSKLLNLKVGSVSQFNVSKAGAIQTSAPSVGSAHAWKLGSYAAGGTGTATGVIYIEVNGQIYSIPALLGTP